MRHTLSNRRLLGALLVSLPALLAASCRPGAQLPAKSSKEYGEAVRAFYVGLAALQVGDDVRADERLAALTKLVPAEPAGWANWGLLALRQRNFDAASERLARAQTLAPESDQIAYLTGLLESSRGRSAESVAALRKAVEANPQNLVATFKLAEEIERQGGESSEAEFQRLVRQILAARPDNLAALLELARVSAKRGDAETLRAAVAKISAHSAGWPPEVQQQLSAVQTAAAADPTAAATRVAFLRNVLVRVPEFRQDLAAIKPPPGEEAQPFTRFLRLETPTFAPAPADTSLSFAPEQLPGTAPARFDWIGAVSLDGEGAPTVIEANGHEVRLAGGATYPFPGGPQAAPPGPEGVLALDFNYDFKTDLALAGAGGVRLLKQETANSFTDVTAQAKLPADVTGASYTGAWAADIEADGDLDIVLGCASCTPTVLRNNGDGTFAAIAPFAKVSGLRAFAWADFDADGDPDAALIDGAGRLHVFANERAGQFGERAVPANFPAAKALGVADANDDGVLDLLVVQSDGVITRLSDKNEGRDWETAELARVANAPDLLAGDVRLLVADLDNNGGLDLVLTPDAPGTSNANAVSAGALVWLSDGHGQFKRLDKPPAAPRVFAAADLDGDGRLDLLGLAADGQPVRLASRGAKSYHWQQVRPRAAKAVGDQRINSFGVGGEMEVRSGLLVQKQPIAGPLVHFGLGEQPAADVVRIVWPNGSVRAEFDLKADQTVAAEQRLKGSCPFLFAWDGRAMRFVKDAVPWGSAIGLRINTLGTARVEATEEWYKIGRDQLAPRDGYYDLRFTAELWETYYYDQLALLAVDHPAGTEVFVDERFVVPPARLAITTVEPPHRIARAWDDEGRDVTDAVSALDGKYLDTFGRGRYQGVTRDHFVEVDLGDDAPRAGPLYLIAQGWMHPTDSSINVAISQGADVRPAPLSLEVPDGRGGWVTAEPNLGFPAGRKKICLFDLSRAFRPGTPRRLRLRTNLEVYWDCLQWAQGLAGAPVRTTRIDPSVADLRYRGYSVVERADDSSPELPDYDRLASSKQVWRDLVGYYTRFGDVRELLRGADDRYVIMNAGDELALRFPAPPAPPSGWVRDFVIAGDGWIKDGDYNSTFSQTVQPLPYHARQEYTTTPGRLEDEEVFKRHPEDWQTFHTRFVTPEVFRDALRPPKQR